jgi:hypothetical protein
LKLAKQLKIRLQKQKTTKFENPIMVRNETNNLREM